MKRVAYVFLSLCFLAGCESLPVPPHRSESSVSGYYWLVVNRGPLYEELVRERDGAVVIEIKTDSGWTEFWFTSELCTNMYNRKAFTGMYEAEKAAEAVVLGGCK